MARRVLLTGTSGFVGRYLLAALCENGYEVVAASRATRSPETIAPGVVELAVGDIGVNTDWRPAMEGCTALVHLAALTPLPGVSPEKLTEVNDLGTARLMSQAAESSVELVVNLSSILAVVDNSFDDTVDDGVRIQATSPYARSKQAAEHHVATLLRSDQTGVSLRPPLVYGVQAKGNWRTLRKLAASPFPLPFGEVHNRRSLIAVENLVDAILAVLNAPRHTQVSGSFVVADDGTASLADILSWLRGGMGRKPGLWNVPPEIIEALLTVAGRRQMATSLLRDLAIDASRFKKCYRWTPALPTCAATQACGAAYQAARRP